VWWKKAGGFTTSSWMELLNCLFGGFDELLRIKSQLIARFAGLKYYILWTIVMIGLILTLMMI